MVFINIKSKYIIYIDIINMNFTDLRHMEDPKYKHFSIPSISDQDVYKFSPKRFRFYLKLQNALNDPETLKKVLYKYTEIKRDVDRQDEIIQEIVDDIKQVSLFYDEDKINDLINKIKISLNTKLNDNNTSLITTDLKNIISKKTVKKVGGGVDDEPKNNNNPDLNKEDNIIDPNIIYNYKKPIEAYNKNVDKIVGENNNSTLNLDAKKINQLKTLIDRSKNDEYLNKLNITYTDRIIFICTTYIIRLISLLLVEWSLNAGIINSFNNAFICYCIIYIILFIFIIMIVNVNYNYPIVQLYTDNSITNIPSLFYYFYIYTNGITRLIAHIFIISMLMIIPFIIKDEKVSNDNKEIAFNYKLKNKINTSLSNFSLIIHGFTSIIALKF